MNQRSAAIKAFGLGCFVFEVKPSANQDNFEVEWWRTELLAALGGISSVSSVSVDVDVDQLVDGVWQFDKADETRPALQEFLPSPTGSRVAFEIAIPRRMHPDLLDGQTFSAENFRVETFYGYFGPATVVTCLDGDESTDGSLAVRLLWRFLRSEFHKHTRTLKFTNLGPSPFHAQFWLEEGPSGQDRLIEWEELGRFGYADVRLTYDPDSFVTVDDAYRHTCATILDELSLFYFLKTNANYQMEVSLFLASQTAELMSMHVANGFGAAVRRIFRTGPEARGLGLEALGYKLDLTNRYAGASRAITDLYEQSSVIGVLREQLDKACVTKSAPEIETALEVVRFAEGSRGKELEIAIISASTLLGGVAGAVAALVAGS